MKAESLHSGLGNTRMFARLCSCVMIACFLNLALALVMGTLLTGHIPVYGIDPEPSVIGYGVLNAFQINHILLLMASMPAVPAWMLLMIHLLAHGRGTIGKDKNLWLLTIACITGFFYLRQTRAFAWLMD